MRLDIRSSAIKIKLAVTFLSFLFLTACGGGGGGGLAVVTPPAVTPAVVIDSTMPDVSNFMATSFKPHEYYRRFCESPREGTDDKQGSVLIENYWLRSWTHDLYLWYSQVNYSNPAFFNDKIEYFNTLKTNALTPSGNPVDRFHFIYDTDEWELMSESGVKTGYGMSHATTNSSLPRQVYVQYVELNSPAFNAGIRRGTRIIEVDGADLLNGNTQSDFDTFNAGLFPEGNNELHSFVMLHPGDTSNSSFSMTSTAVTTSPVLISDVKTTTTGKVGYLVFNSHVAASEQQLVDVFTEFEAEGVSDLILDLRYNGGGLLAIASQIAYMITGAADTAGKIFESLIFNDQHQVLSPIT